MPNSGTASSLTYAVVEGLNGKGDLGAKQRISTKDLAGYPTALVLPMLVSAPVAQPIMRRAMEILATQTDGVGASSGLRPSALR